MLRDIDSAPVMESSVGNLGFVRRVAKDVTMAEENVEDDAAQLWDGRILFPFTISRIDNVTDGAWETTLYADSAQVREDWVNALRSCGEVSSGTTQRKLPIGNPTGQPSLFD